MIDSLSSAARLAPPVVAKPDAAPAVSPASVAVDTAADAGGQSAAKPAKVALSVDRDDAGVFVYTLTDSASGKVLAVIPRSAVSLSAPPVEQGVDMQA